MTSKSRANCCSKFTYWYSNTLIDSVALNGGKLEECMIEDMNDNPDRDRQLLLKFQERLQSSYERWKMRNPGREPTDEWYGFTKSAISAALGCEFFTVTFFVFLSEGLTLGSLFMIKLLAEYLEEEGHDIEKAVILVSVFTGSILLGTLFKNFYIYYGYTMALEFRKLLVAAMYDKVGKLSMRSLTETNSGKLIALVSSDIFTLERPLSMAPFVFVAPVMNLACYTIVWLMFGWVYAVVIFALWVIMFLFQMCVARYQRTIKQAEAMRNDERMKLVNDMITGIRTIKSYAWENHYSRKVREARAQQENKVFWLNLVGGLGFSLFQNVGMIGVLCIFLP